MVSVACRNVDGVGGLKAGVLGAVAEEEEAALFHCAALRERICVGLEPLVVQLVEVSLGVGQNGGNTGVLAVHDRQIDSDVDRVEIVIVHADGVVLAGGLTRGNGQRNGLAVLEQVEAEAAQLAGDELVPIGIAHASGTGILELKAHGENKGVGEEVLVVERQINAVLAVTGSVLSGGLGGVAAVSPHIDREVGRAEERLVVQQGRADLAAGVLVSANGDIEQVEVSAVGIQTVNVGPHELCARIAGVARHFEHTVGHHLGHLDDRVNADALVGGVPPTLVAREDSAKGGHLVAEVRGERATGRANGIGDIQQVGGAVKLGGIILDAGAVAGILQRGQQVVVRQVEGRIGELGDTIDGHLIPTAVRLLNPIGIDGDQREALRFECRDNSVRCSIVSVLSGMQASDIHRDGELAVGIEAVELIAALDAAHQSQRQVGSAIVGIAEQLGGDAHVLTDVGLALFAVAEEQVGETGGSFLQLEAGGERLVEEIHTPNDGVLAVLRHGHFHRNVGIDLEGQNAAFSGALDLGSRTGGSGQPAARGRSGFHRSDERSDICLARLAHVKREDGAGSDLRGAAVDDVLEGLVTLAQRHAGAGGQQAERLAAIGGEIHFNFGRPSFRVADDHGETGVGGVGRDGGLLTVEGLVGPVVIEAGVAGIVGDIHVLQGILDGGDAGVAVLVSAHDDADAAVKLHAGIHQRLGGKERGKGRAAVVLNARTVEPAVLDVRGVVSGGIQFTRGVDPAVQVALGVVGLSGGVEMAERHDHFRSVGIADLNINILVVLTLHDFEAEVLGKLLDPGELRGFSVAFIVVCLNAGNGERILAGDAAGILGAIGDGVVAGAGGKAADQGVGVIGAVADDHVADVTAEIFDGGVDLCALIVRNGHLIGDVRRELAVVIGFVALLALEVDRSILNERTERSVAEIQINAGASGIFQRVALRMPLERQSEETILMLNGFHDTVGGAGDDGQALAEVLGINCLMVRGSDEIDALAIAEDLAEPLGLVVIDGNVFVADTSAELMVARAAAVNQTVHANAQMAVLAGLSELAELVIIGVGVFIIGLAELLLDRLGEVKHRVAGVLNEGFKDIGKLLALLRGERFEGSKVHCGRAGEDFRHAVERDLAVQDLLAEVIGNVLNELAAHGDVEALLAAADGQHRHVERHSLLHQLDVRGVAGVIRAAGAVRGLELAVEVRVPVFAAGHEDTVELMEDRSGLRGIGDPRKEDRERAVALVGLGKALVVTADLVLLPGNADHGTLVHGRDFDADQALVVQKEVSRDCLAERALAGRTGEVGGSCIGNAHHGLQSLDRIDAVAGGVGHRNGRGHTGSMHVVVFEFALIVDLVENCILNQRANGGVFRCAVFGGENTGRHHAEQHDNRQEETGRAG